MTAGASVNNSLITVLPGDNVTHYILDESRNKPKLGTGLRYDDDDDDDDTSNLSIFATLAGRLVSFQNTFYVRRNSRRYNPAVHDRVVGIIEDRSGASTNGGDVYRVNIGASHPALLNNVTAFEGATKRNRPTFQPGQVIYARVLSCLDEASETVLSCKLGPDDAGVPSKDWMTNEGVYGELRGGTVGSISTGLARELLKPDAVVLVELGKAKISFEVAVGVNGMVWIHSSLPEYTIMIQNAILNSEVLTEAQVRSMVKSLVYTVEKQLQRDRDAAES